MSDQPWMPLYPADYWVDTRDLSIEEHGIYLNMLMLAWRQPNGCLPNDEKWLRTNLPPMHGRTFNYYARRVITKYFSINADNQLENKRLSKEKRKAIEMRSKQSRNALERWSRPLKDKEISDAVDMPSQSQSQSQYKEREGVVRLRREEFIEVDSPEWEAWSKLKHWPQNDFRVDGRIRRGWHFPTRWPSSEYRPKLNGGSAPLAQEGRRGAKLA